MKRTVTTTKNVVKIFAVRREVLERLLDDPAWSKKLDDCVTTQDYFNVLRAFVQSKKLKVHIV